MDTKNWFLMPYARYDGAFNMALDAYFAANYSEKLDRPLLRFYGWNPFCLSLGIHQKTEDLNLEECRKRNVDVVRRPTGGRAVLHAQELTYSVIVPVPGYTLPQIYEYMHLRFAEALRFFNIPAELESTQPNLREFYKKKHSNMCFASAAKTEIKVNHKKLIGSAQHLFKNSILQHGSILIGGFHLNIVELMKLGEKEKSRFQSIIRRSTFEIEQMNANVTPIWLSEKIVDALKESGISFSRFQLSESDLKAIEKLKERYIVHDAILAENV